MHSVRAQVGEVDLRIGREIRLEAGVVGGLVGEVELLLDRVAEDLHRGAERHQPQRRDDALAGARQGDEDGAVVAHLVDDVRAPDLDRHDLAVAQLGAMHLRHRGGRDRLVVETAEHLVQRAAELGLDQRPHRRRGKRRHAVLQRGQLLDQRPRQQIGARRRDLADLDERRAELGAQPYQRDPGGARRRVRPAHRQPMADEDRPGERDGAGDLQRTAEQVEHRGCESYVGGKGKRVGEKTKGKETKGKRQKVRMIRPSSFVLHLSAFVLHLLVPLSYRPRREVPMPRHIDKPTRITAAGNKPKLIDEYVGRVNSSTAALSIAHMRSPGGWSEPRQRPEFTEYTVVLGRHAARRARRRHARRRAPARR